MTDRQVPTPPQHVEALKQRLLGRIAAATAVIAGLLAALAVLDGAKRPPHLTPPPVAAPMAETPPAAPGRIAAAVAAPEAAPPVAPGAPAGAKREGGAAAPAQDIGMAPPAAAGRVTLQVGVFANVANAEALRDKLKRSGVAAQIETRVEVGPFADRREAEAARQRLIALGVEPGIVLPARKQDGAPLPRAPSSPTRKDPP